MDDRDKRRGPRGGPGDRSSGPRGAKPATRRDGDRPARRPDAEADGGERIAKRLARAGVTSRRDAEALIAAGRIVVNGKVLDTPAFNVTRQDRIELDGKPIPEVERTRVFLFHKPAGLVTTNRDPEGRRTVFEALPEGLPRLVTVGRLDINTEGLLLLTNDGGLARLLELPATGWLRRYRARVHGKVDERQLASLREGIAIDGIFYGAIEAELERLQGSNAWLTIGLREGKNREVKNILGSLGLEVTRLIRVSYGPFQLGELEEGAVLEIKGRTLRDQLGDRLIAESGADFEAPVTTPFSNRPVAAGPRTERAVAPPPRAMPEPGEGGLIKNCKRQREERRSDALSRLQTRPAKPGRREREERPVEPRRPRNSNVWMAPGARPVGDRKPAAPDKAAEPRDEERPVRRPRPGGGEGGQRSRARRFDTAGDGERGQDRRGDEPQRSRARDARDAKPFRKEGRRPPGKRFETTGDGDRGQDRRGADAQRPRGSDAKPFRKEGQRPRPVGAEGGRAGGPQKGPRRDAAGRSGGPSRPPSRDGRPGASKGGRPSPGGKRPGGGPKGSPGGRPKGPRGG